MNPYFEIVKSDISETELQSFLQHYLNNITWEQDTYVFNGVSVTPKRQTYMYGKDYFYSGQLKKGHSFDAITKLIQSRIEKTLNLNDGCFNACLANYYPDGSASISYHTDDEKEMPKDSQIISFSLGSTRKFYFQPIDKTKSKEVIKLEILPGEILVMKAGCQQVYMHSIPKEPNITTPRVSLTFRTFKA